MTKLIDPNDYHMAAKKLREFFENRGFVEVATQNRLSILAACEDPRTISTYNYAGNLWPLPQTGQMWLEHEILSKPEAPGYFCLSTSYRNEPNPIEGRHDLIFPMFEFETHGGFDELKALEEELLIFLGFGSSSSFAHGDYRETAEHYGVEEIAAAEEDQIWKDYGKVFFLERFPEHTSPFWNMTRSGDGATSNKIDVLLYGVETIGSAERSTDKDEMRDRFHTISDGMYADILYAQFGRERVLKELEDFLSFDFFKRCGGGIGMTRMIRALKMLEEEKAQSEAA